MSIERRRAATACTASSSSAAAPAAWNWPRSSVDRLGKKGRAHVTLIEKSRTHFWKPHLHEIAAGSADLHSHATDYLAQSHWHGFRYRVGEMVGLDRDRREVIVEPAIDEEGVPITPPYVRGYDTLVIAVGSLTNDFGTPGVRRARHRAGDAVAGRALPPPPGQRLHPRAHADRAARAAPAAGGDHRRRCHGRGARRRSCTRRRARCVSYNLERIDPERDIRLTSDRGRPAHPAGAARAHLGAARKLLAAWA